MLPKILSSAGHLPAIHPTDKQTIQQGMIYIALLIFVRRA